MKFFSVYGLIAGIAYGQMLTDLSKFSIYEMIGFLISISITLGILMFTELLVREKEKKMNESEKSWDC